MPGPAESSGPLSLAISPGDKIANLEAIVPLSPPLSQNPPSAPLLQRGGRGDLEQRGVMWAHMPAHPDIPRYFVWFRFISAVLAFVKSFSAVSSRDEQCWDPEATSRCAARISC